MVISDFRLTMPALPVFDGYDAAGNEIVLYVYRVYATRWDGTKYVHPYFGNEQNVKMLADKIRKAKMIELDNWYLVPEY